MARHRSAALDAFVREQGGLIDEAHGDRVVTFPDADQAPDAMAADAKEIEAAIARAREYGTTCIRLWRERGEGWYAAVSREEHPGFWYVGQIDELTGQPVGDECVASHVCHHLGAMVAEWRLRRDYEANGAAALAGWTETLNALPRQKRPIEEDWT